MWENSLERLKVLNYEAGFCSKKGKKTFSRVYFVLPATNASHQFDDFVDICAWLCSEIKSSGDGCFQRDQYDDPSTVANKLMLALRNLGFTLSFPFQKLKTPYGEAICSVIDFLTDKALTVRGFKWESPKYSKNDEVIFPLVSDNLQLVYKLMYLD
jgi:estrogen-related receptor beta like 1